MKKPKISYMMFFMAISVVFCLFVSCQLAYADKTFTFDNIVGTISGEKWLSESKSTIYAMGPGDTLFLDFNLKAGYITVEDELFNENETLFMNFVGSAATGGVNVDYNYWFDGTTGDPLLIGTQANPVTGSFLLTTASPNISRGVDLIAAGKSFSFTGVHAEFTLGGSGSDQWHIANTQLGVESDDTTKNNVAEPTTIVSMLLGLFGFALKNFRRRG